MSANNWSSFIVFKVYLTKIYEAFIAFFPNLFTTPYTINFNFIELQFFNANQLALRSIIYNVARLPCAFVQFF